MSNLESFKASILIGDNFKGDSILLGGVKLDEGLDSDTK